MRAEAKPDRDEMKEFQHHSIWLGRCGTLKAPGTTVSRRGPFEGGRKEPVSARESGTGNRASI
jgi:hypothetical protein